MAGRKFSPTWKAMPDMSHSHDTHTQARDLWNARLDQLEDYLDSLPDPKAPK